MTTHVVQPEGHAVNVFDGWCVANAIPSWVMQKTTPHCFTTLPHVYRAGKEDKERAAMLPTPTKNRVLQIEPSDVQLFRLFDFVVAYERHAEEHGLDRFGTPPEFTFTVRPGFEIHVTGTQRFTE